MPARLRGKYASGSVEVVVERAAVNYEYIQNVDIEFYWSSNIGESLELREIQWEALSEDEEGELIVNRVEGIGGFVAWDLYPFLIDFEYIAALNTFGAGLLDDEPMRPRTWNLEAGINPLERWQFAARIESTKHLPDSPQWQYGLAASYGVMENFIVTANYLRAEYREDPSRRNLVQVELIYEF